MRFLRVGFTIRRLMVVVLVVALMAFGVRMYRSRLQPSVAEIQAQARYQQARLVREVTEYALKEYTEGIFVQDQAKAKGQIALARSDFEIEQARTQLLVLEQYTKGKQQKSLFRDIEKAQADEASKLSTYKSERSRRLWWGSGN